VRQTTSLGFAVALALGFAPKADAQVAADIRINSWPVAGTIYIGDRPRPRRVVVEHAYPRRIVVEHRRGYGPYKNKGWRRNARVAVVYYDRHCNEYFDRYRRGLERVRAYEYDGRFYRDYDERRYDEYDRRDDRYGRDRRYDQHDRNRRDRDDRDYDERDHGSWEHDH
jgi:hypothetical protein